MAIEIDPIRIILDFKRSLRGLGIDPGTVEISMPTTDLQKMIHAVDLPAGSWTEAQCSIRGVSILGLLFRSSAGQKQQRKYARIGKRVLDMLGAEDD